MFFRFSLKTADTIIEAHNLISVNDLVIQCMVEFIRANGRIALVIAVIYFSIQARNSELI